jgi:tropinone reductase I
MIDPRWRLDGRVALVSGASVGIGRAIAAELLAFGADVLLTAREEGPLESTRARACGGVA